MNPDQTHMLQLRGRLAVCVESITDVVAKAKGLAGKVFVIVERRMGAVGKVWWRRKLEAIEWSGGSDCREWDDCNHAREDG
jgi:hypothetical protein